MRFSPVGDCPNAKLKQYWSCFDCNVAKIATSITCFPSYSCCCRCCSSRIWFNNNMCPHPVDEANARAAFKLQFMCLRRLTGPNYLVRILPEYAQSCWPAMGLVCSALWAGHKNCSRWRIPWPKKEEATRRATKSSTSLTAFSSSICSLVLVDLFDMARTNS